MCRLRIELAKLCWWTSQVWYRIILLFQHVFEHNIARFELWGSYCLSPLHVGVLNNCMSKRCVFVFLFLKLFRLWWCVVYVWEANSDFYISHLVSRWVPVWQFLVGRCARFLTHHGRCTQVVVWFLLQLQCFGFLFEPSRRWLQHWFRHLCFEIRVLLAFDDVVDGSTLICFLSFLNTSCVCNLIVICLPTVFFLVVNSHHHRVAFV